MEKMSSTLQGHYYQSTGNFIALKINNYPLELEYVRFGWQSGLPGIWATIH